MIIIIFITIFRNNNLDVHMIHMFFKYSIFQSILGISAEKGKRKSMQFMILTCDELESLVQFENKYKPQTSK